jgi:hypothetical protein
MIRFYTYQHREIFGSKLYQTRQVYVEILLKMNGGRWPGMDDSVAHELAHLAIRSSECRVSFTTPPECVHILVCNEPL